MSHNIKYDSVVDGNIKPIFNGPRDEVLKWIENNPTVISEQDLWVVTGRTLAIMTIDGYKAKTTS